MSKQILFSQHALDRLSERGTTKEEVEATINTGERLKVKWGRIAFRKNFSFTSHWKNRYYDIKQVMVIVTEDNDKMVVVTVFSFFFGGRI
jgi:hypothetical protein